MLKSEKLTDKLRNMMWWLKKWQRIQRTQFANADQGQYNAVII